MGIDGSKLDLDDWSNLIYSCGMNTKTNDTRQHILDVGYQLVVAKGFTSVGLSTLLKTADVPKGSFYHYFKSKEQFGEALIEDYFSQYIERINHLLTHSEGSGRQRLLSYFDLWLNVEDGRCNAYKCLVVKLSAEVSDLSPSMREALLQGATQVIAALGQCIQSGIEDGSIDTSANGIDSHSMAQTLYHQWLGASLMSKLTQNQEGLEQAMTITKQLLK
ncbi:TetR family transcriptional regulator [Vibrio genomosp. F10]|uniref:TetR family transcriptional regulator n=2 Tax=Vibrio genomosp. F10 TaxID=723171 RepID=A0A1B9R1B8_9VIBR|nr:TetR family transcriptional regulator [Vibrio genomosp. F10]